MTRSRHILVKASVRKVNDKNLESIDVNDATNVEILIFLLERGPAPVYGISCNALA